MESKTCSGPADDICFQSAEAGGLEGQLRAHPRRPLLGEHEHVQAILDAQENHHQYFSGKI